MIDPATLTNTHLGEEAIIMGNGPSLLTVPRAYLESMPTFGANYINRLPWQPTYYVCIDKIVLTEHAKEIYPVAARARAAFLSAYHATAHIPALQRLYALNNAVHLYRDTFPLAGSMCMSGYTCVYVALKIALVMGFETVYLVGVDHSEDWRHFTEDYPKGIDHKLEGQRYHFRLAADAYKSAGRKIINLSAPSKLDEIFERGHG